MIDRPIPRQLYICIDEAGRGPLAGPVSVGLTMSLGRFDKSIFKDSKQLTEKKREELRDRIRQFQDKGKLIAARGMASNMEIDELGIMPSLQIATCRGLFALLKQFYILRRRSELLNSEFGEDHVANRRLLKLFNKRKITPQVIAEITSIPNYCYQLTQLLIDGNHTFGLDEYLSCNIETIIKGDQKVPLISAASIVAKVVRDHWMVRIDKYFSDYGLAQHKGYGIQFHRDQIAKLGLSLLHRKSFCQNITAKRSRRKINSEKRRAKKGLKMRIEHRTWNMENRKKPKGLLHVCCAPDLAWPLNWLKKYFHLQLFRYNPNIHPRKEHNKRYEQFIKLMGLEKGEYDVLEDRYDPQEFFDGMNKHREIINPKLKKSKVQKVIKTAGEMSEQSDRCNPCYYTRLQQAAKIASEDGIPYFTSTLLISPKKNMDKLYQRGKESENLYPDTKFLRFDFAKNDGHHHATRLTKKHGLWRQNYCGCGWTIPKETRDKKGETKENRKQNK